MRSSNIWYNLDPPLPPKMKKISDSFTFSIFSEIFQVRIGLEYLLYRLVVKCRQMRCPSDEPKMETFAQWVHHGKGNVHLHGNELFRTMMTRGIEICYDQIIKKQVHIY